MVIDTSAVLAILLGEPEAERFANAIERGHCHMSAASYLEAAIVIESRGDSLAYREFDLFFRRSRIVIEPVTLEQAQVARQAFRDFGKGRHKAALNFGDCFSYALAKTRDEPLLFKGNDFGRAGVESALEIKS